MSNSGSLLPVMGVTAALAYAAWQKTSAPLKRVEAHDGRSYMVRTAESDRAAETLADLVARCEKLIESLDGKDPRAQRLRARFDPSTVSELARDEKGVTSYSVNKGEQLVFCLRDPATGAFEKMNDLTFVAIHELAHLAVPADVHGHPPEFWRTMDWLLECAERAGIWTRHDYSRKPSEYCGLTINSMPSQSA